MKLCNDAMMLAMIEKELHTTTPMSKPLLKRRRAALLDRIQSCEGYPSKCARCLIEAIPTDRLRTGDNDDNDDK